LILLDSNVVIYGADPARPSAGRFLRENVTAVSAISYVEALGYHRISAVERWTLERFFEKEPMFPIDSPVLDEAVSLRQQQKLSLGDALIAATALVHDLPLATYNAHDFRNIPGLQLVVPE